MPAEGNPVATYDEFGMPTKSTTEEIAPTEISPQETKAREDGWVGKSEWEEMGKDPEDHVSPREFNRAGEMIGRIKSQNIQLGDLRSDLKVRNERLDAVEKTMRSLIDHNQSITNSQMETAKRDAYTQRAEAAQEGDTQKVAELDVVLEQIKDLSQDRNTVISKPIEEDVVHVEDPNQSKFNLWVGSEENSKWFADDVLRGSFLAIGDTVAGEMGVNTPLETILEESKKRLVKEFPAKMGGKVPPRASGDPLTSGKTTSGGSDTKSGYTFNDLSPAQKKVCEVSEEFGLSRQEYVDQLASIGGID